MKSVAPGSATIAFVGTGVMGRPMAGHVLDAGYDVVVFNRTPERARDLVERGATRASSAGEAANAADVVITIVGYPADVEEVYFAPGGILERIRPGSIVIDMTTSSPVLAQRIAAEASARGAAALDAPVSGGDVGARNATLTIMAGGDSDVFAQVEPLLRVMGRSVLLQGGSGAGQHAKLANQIAIAGSMLATVESLAYARAAGLDPWRVLDSIGAGSAASWSLENLAPRMLKEDFAPGFFVKHFLKDMRIALESAESLGLELPGLVLAKQLYDRLADEGGTELGTQALWLLYGDDTLGQTAGLVGDSWW